MDQVLNFIQSYFPFLIEHKYLFLFLGAAIEGISTLVIGGFLISTDSVSILPALLAFAFGHTLNGVAWYLVGYYGGAKSIDKWVRSKENSRKVLERVEYYFQKHSGKAIFMTKFTFSLTAATQIMAGSLKYDFKKYLWYNFWGSVSWAAFAMAVGYFFGISYRLLIVYAKDLAYLIIFLSGAIILSYVLKAMLRSAFVKTVMAHDTVQHYREKLKSGIDKIWPNGDSV